MGGGRNGPDNRGKNPRQPRENAHNNIARITKTARGCNRGLAVRPRLGHDWATMGPRSPRKPR
eukprot:11206949-Lingulodinium_polyedra.AAC.1